MPSVDGLWPKNRWKSPPSPTSPRWQSPHSVGDLQPTQCSGGVGAPEGLSRPEADDFGRWGSSPTPTGAISRGTARCASSGADHRMSERSARDVVEEFARRQEANDVTVLDELVAEDMVNHAAGPQGREGLRQILQTIEHDLGPISFEQHHLVADGDLVVQHVTVHGTHRASTMPLLDGVPVAGRPATWRFIHIWRVVDGMIVEHWACRDDMGLVELLTPVMRAHLPVRAIDMEATRTQLTARGVDVDQPTSPDGSSDFWTAMLADPDGNRIELVQWPPGHAAGITAADQP